MKKIMSIASVISADFYIFSKILTFKSQPHEMVKHTQTICRQQRQFQGLALKGLQSNIDL